MKLRIALAQINPTVGDISGNVEKILDGIQQAKKAGAAVVAFPEQAVCGYPAEDLLLRPHFLKANAKAVEQIANATKGVIAIVGFAELYGCAYNSAAVCSDGKVAAVYRKMHLPNYAVFDEDRYFEPGKEPMVIDLGGFRIGLSVCEDIWQPGSPENEEALSGGAHAIVNLSASPFFAEKAKSRADMMSETAKSLSSYVCFANTIGGQDELVFDGNSTIFDPNGDVVAHAKSLAEDFLVYDLDSDVVSKQRSGDARFLSTTGEGVRIVPVALPETSMDEITPRIEPWLEGPAEVYEALMLGIRDYIGKNGFKKVILGLSGGVDSALTATIAADALGAENVLTLFMPSRFTSDESHKDARALAKNLGIECITVPIGDVFKAYKATLAPHFKGLPENIAEENIQARIRGNLLMAFSNKFGHMVLSTGNKSENSVGYATLYGDMAGGFNIIKDVLKEKVYALCRYRNGLEGGPVIPERILTRPPTAELREDQKDSDSLPEYDVLDPILKMYVEDDLPLHKIVEAGYDSETVSRIIRMVDFAEYKRRQSCPGVKITPRAFGKDRRLPITNRYRNGEE